MSASSTASTICSYCKDSQPHPQFAQLMSDRRTPAEDLASGKSVGGLSAWDYTRQPIWNLQCHNRHRRMLFGPKQTKQGAPYHQNTLIIGPFDRNSNVFVHVMRDFNRKFHNRFLRGVCLALEWHLLDPFQKNPLRLFGPDDLAQQAALTTLCKQAKNQCRSKQFKQIRKRAKDILEKMYQEPKQMNEACAATNE